MLTILTTAAEGLYGYVPFVLPRHGKQWSHSERQSILIRTDTVNRLARLKCSSGSLYMLVSRCYFGRV